MKLTLVIDTDDREGILDSFKIVKHFYQKYAGGDLNHGHRLSYGKIKHIKMLRSFAKCAIAAHERGDDPSSLKFTKKYADKLFRDDPDNPSI